MDPVAETPDRPPMAVVVAGLAAHARGEEVDRDAMEDAATVIAAANLVSAGMSMDAVERLFTERDHSFKFTYDAKTDELGVEVIWDDPCPESATADGQHCKCDHETCCWCGAERPPTVRPIPMDEEPDGA